MITRGQVVVVRAIALQLGVGGMGFGLNLYISDAEISLGGEIGINSASDFSGCYVGSRVIGVSVGAEPE
jgi:hypothetical protein